MSDSDSSSDEEEPVVVVVSPSKKKKSKKEKKEKKDKKKKKKEKKKRKKSESSDEDAAAPLSKKAKASSDAAIPPVPPPRRRTRSFDALEAVAAASKEMEKDAAGNPPIGAPEFALSPMTIANLLKKGITHMYPIQAQTFPIIFRGGDIIGRARTGQGKTLGFALPIIERLLREPSKRVPGLRGSMHKIPSAVILSPTRELARQIASDFTEIAPQLQQICIYGGAAYGPQINALQRGVDIIVGTPGRVVDHLQSGRVDMTGIKFFVLDEADQMLDMGFQPELDKVFDALDSGSPAVDEHGTKSYQILLFSATLPAWVNKVARQRLQNGFKTVDLVKGSVNKASIQVQHLVMRCPWQTRPSVINDMLTVHADGGESRAIVFCDTKKDCNELSVDSRLKYDCRTLHGDIPQKQREVTMKAFKDGKFKVLVATDVAARGLHVEDVRLVVNFAPPSTRSGYADTET
tara:strand:+ start:661 stop:2046 length:1386 start_codon:yes stop_codon:yes gene_type:complete